MRRRGLAEFLRQRAEVVPQRDHLRRNTRVEQLHVIEAQYVGAWDRVAEHVSFVFSDAMVFQHAETSSAMGEPKTYPRFHRNVSCDFFAAMTRLVEPVAPRCHVRRA